MKEPIKILLVDDEENLDPKVQDVEPGEDALRVALEAGWVAAGAVVVVERSTRDEETHWPDGLSLVSRRRYGETTLWYLHRCGDHDTVAE